MSKSPFEKVRSLVERRKLFEALLIEQTEILCKGEDESLFNFKPIALVSDSLLQGYMTAIEKTPQQDLDALGNFSVGVDRYFFKAPFKIMGDEAAFHVACDVFQLQRRATMRLHPHQDLGVYLALTEFQNKPIYTIAQIADISSGGARIFFSQVASPIPASTRMENPGLRQGDRFRCVLHLSDNKTLDLMAEVKHIQQAVHLGAIVDHLGVEFVDFTPVVKNRLMAMTMDLQQKMILGD